MPFLVINGFPIPILEDGAVEHEPLYAGGFSRGNINSLQGTRDFPKRNFSFVTKPFTAAELAELEAAGLYGETTLPDPFIGVTGDFVGGAILLCLVHPRDTLYIPDGMGGFQLQFTLDIEEV